ncbi:MAG: ROK family protein [Chloroflexota bacterium]|nr:ROK family protein [Dehalococcoidia bacterium]MDW8045915.1 ROK family protein [Chloroflexota bacterium]
MTAAVLAVDLGATRMRAAAVSAAGVLRGRAERRTPEGSDPESVVAALVDLLRSVRERAPEAEAVCVAAAGLVAGDEGRIVVAPNIPGFRDIPLAALLTERLGLPAFVENDASAAALGEFRFGAGRGVRHLLHATLGTGIGGGIVIDGRLYRGAKGFAGEIGHIILDPSGPRCGCGARGCLEALASGTAFAQRARRLVESGKAPILAELTAGREPTGEDLLAAARAGDLAAEAEIRNGGHMLGLGLASLLNVLNPDELTLSGGLLAMGELLLEPMRRAMRALPYGPAAGTAIRLTELGDDAGLLGAAAVAFERLEG